MKPSVVGIVAGLVVVGALGYFIGRSKGGTGRAPSACAATATVEYDVATRTMRVIGNTTDPKAVLVDFPDLEGSASDVCWDFRMVNGTAKFKTLKIVTTPPAGEDGRPILVGDGSFKGATGSASLRYSGSRPLWSSVRVGGTNVTGVSWKFDVKAELVDGGSITYDPDIIIIKDKPKYR